MGAPYAWPNGLFSRFVLLFLITRFGRSNLAEVLVSVQSVGCAFKPSRIRRDGESETFKYLMISSLHDAPLELRLERLTCLADL